MTLIAVIFLSLLVTQIKCGCPIRCNCTDNSISCISNKLDYVPYFESITNNPLIIDLSGNSIAIIDIDDFSFEKSDEVQEIFLNGSELIMIEEKAFNELENLQGLYLGNNYLNNLPEDFIANNENLILLDISSNYFPEMPKIRSKSLEVLAIANSGVSTIADNVLQDLPNLRVLLLEQNNLKTINTAIFSDVHNLFFVKLAYNPWQCDCQTLKLFQYLNNNQFLDSSEMLKCQNYNKTFIDIFDEWGITSALTEQCTNKINFPEAEAKTISLGEISEEFFNEEPEKEFDMNVIYVANWQQIILLAFAIFVSLIVGSIFGSIVTYKYLNSNIRITESRRELLSTS